MRVAIEQASGEKYRSMGASLAVWLVPSRVDFYTVSHNINRVKEFFAKWYKKAKSRQSRPKPTLRPRRSAAAGRAPIEPEIALGKALDLFRKDGFAATSLDDLSAATGMNRPSLYGAFGDKRELYIKSYQRYRADARAAMVDIFRDERRSATAGAHLRGGARYLSLGRGRPARLLYGDDGSLRSGLRSRDPRHGAGGFSELDKAFTTCFRIAKENGELPERADPVVLAQLASATIHTIAIRARARVPRKELEAIVNGAIDVMCGGEIARHCPSRKYFQHDLSAHRFPVRPPEVVHRGKERHNGKSKSFRLLGIARRISGPVQIRILEHPFGIGGTVVLPIGCVKTRMFHEMIGQEGGTTDTRRSLRPKFDGKYGRMDHGTKHVRPDTRPMARPFLEGLVGK